VIGRFLSADPFIQFPEFTQSLNRYSYVLNNPLSFTDPTGFKIDWKQIVATVAGAILGAVTGGIANLLFGNALVAIIFSGAGFGFGAAFTGTLLHGGSFSQALRAGLKSGLIGGVTAGLTFGVGHVFFEGLPSFVGSVTKVIAHGAVQGLATMAQGGKFEHGFLSGIFGKLGARFGFIGSVVAAGTAAELGGGKFMNGAVSGAFVYLFNDVQEKIIDFLAKGASGCAYYCGLGRDANKGVDPKRNSIFPVTDIQNKACIRHDILLNKRGYPWSRLDKTYDIHARLASESPYPLMKLIFGIMAYQGYKSYSKQQQQLYDSYYEQFKNIPIPSDGELFTQMSRANAQ